MNNLPQRDIEAMWSLYDNLVKKIDDDSLTQFIEKFGQRFVEQSYSQRTNEPFCGIGGLLEYSLELAKTAKKINEALGFEIDNKKLMRACFLSQFGRIGTDSQARFIGTESSWHKEKLGQYYDWNTFCPKFKISDMTLFLLQSNNLILDWDEWISIKLLDDFKNDDKQFYYNSKSKLTTLLLMSNECVLDKENKRIRDEHYMPF